MIKFTFGHRIREGLGLLLTEEGLEKALESVIETYNWHLERTVRHQVDSIAPSLVAIRVTSRATQPSMMLSSSMK